MSHVRVGKTAAAIVFAALGALALPGCWDFDAAYNACVDAGASCTVDGGANTGGDGGVACPNGLCLVDSYRTQSLYGLLSVWGAAPNRIIMGGAWGTVVRWNGTDFTEDQTNGAYDNMFMTEVTGTSYTDAWGLGSGELIHWTGKNPWEFVNVTGEYLGDVTGAWAESPGQAWIAGENLWDWHADGGVQTALNGPQFYDVWGVTNGRAWAVGANADSKGTIAERVGGTWSAPAIRADYSLRSVHGTADNDVWAVGEYQTVQHLTDAGWASVSLANLPIGFDQTLYDVWANPNGEVWITTRGPKVIKRERDGGWTAFNPPGAEDAGIYQVYGFPSTGDLWIVGGWPRNSTDWNGGIAVHYRQQ